MTVDMNERPPSIGRRLYRAYFARYQAFRTLKHIALMVWWPLRNFAMAINTLRSPRIFYRSYLSKYEIFRLVKHASLMVWWSSRNVVTAIRTLVRPRIFYRTYLARYRIFRGLKKLLLSVYFKYPRLFTWLRFIFTKVKSYHLKPMSEYLAEHRHDVLLVHAAGRLDIPGPKFIGFSGSTFGHLDVVPLNIPRVEIVEMKNVSIFGGGSWVLSGNIAIHPDLFIPERDVTLSEVFGPVSIDLEGGNVFIKSKSKPKKIPVAISLLGQCTGNYAHWLTEVLPKLLIIDSYEKYNSFPLMVDEWVHPNFLEQIKLLGKHSREIICVGRWELVSIGFLIEITPPSYLSHELREYLKTGLLPKPDPDLYSFSKYSLDLLRCSALNASSTYNKNRRNKIYLRRTTSTSGNGRLIDNIAEVERLILKHGFKAIDPSGMSVIEQMATFGGAEFIISPVGAALANAIFTPASCKIIALAPWYENANYYYFSNLMGVLGHDLQYVIGTQVEMDGHAIHRNYSVDIDALNEALETLAG